jgi:FMN phosphatase YigB (HAD superfamily)
LDLIVRTAMKIAIVHYHAGHGGVMEVIRATSRGLAANGVPHVVLTGGERVSGDLPHVTVDGLAYGANFPEAADLLDELRASACAALGAPPDVWHFHNHSLGKNDTMHLLVALLASSNERLLLHIHDLAEDGRPENAMQPGDRTHLYPSGPHVHYAFLNSRDRDCFLRAGLHETRAHLLPNPIQSRTLASAESTFPLLLYPVRGIRRKNLGEFILLTALAPDGTRGAVTRAPLNPAAESFHAGWRRFARECGIAVEFDVVDRLEPVAGSGSSFETWCHHATHFATTSVSEGFGMAFLESISCGKPLLGRKLPHLSSHGIRFPGLYERILIPVDWVDSEIINSALHDAATRLWGAWSREAPDIKSIRSLLVRDGFLDFGNLPEVLQQRVITKLFEPGMKALLMVEHDDRIEPAAAWLAEALRFSTPSATLPGCCDPAVHARNLINIYQKTANAEPAGRIDPEIILDTCLTPARFHFLTSPAPIRRPPPDFAAFRAIIFDIYGTLLIAPAGGVKPDAAADSSLREVIESFGHQAPDSPRSALHAAVLRHHEASALPHPEIDLRAIWREVLALPPDADTTALVIATEAAWHPARLMPGAAEMLRSLAAAGIPLGILSNAQCNTLHSLGDLADIFADDLVVLSYRHGVAKPSRFLFDLLVERLARRGITPEQVLFIGNDPLHDIEPAAARGFTTALFAGHPDSVRAGFCFPDHEILSWQA